MFKINIDSKKLAKRIADIEASSDQIAQEVVKNLGSIVKSNARRYVPVDTGALKQSIDMEVVNDHEVNVGTPLEYGYVQEYGSVNQAPQSFLRPALKDAEQQAPNVMKAVFRKHAK